MERMPAGQGGGRKESQAGPERGCPQEAEAK